MKRVFVLSGNIGSGKTTTLTLLKDNHYQDIEIFLENISEWQYYLEKNSLDPDKYFFFLQMEVLAHFHQLTKKIEKLLETNENVLIFVERSPQEAKEIFLKAKKNDKDYSILCDLFEKYINHPVWKDVIHFYLKASPETCKNRIKTRGRKGEEHIQTLFLEKLDILYNEFIINKQFIINSNEYSDKQAISEQLYQKITVAK